jgi:hypothetical protein
LQDKTFKQLVAMNHRYWKKPSGDYMTIDDLNSKYIREQFGDLYEEFYASVDLGVSVRLGWIALYLDAVKKMKAILDANPTFKLEVKQVKQKFGQLRLYVRTWSALRDDEEHEHLLDPSHEPLRAQIEAIVAEAEAIADHTCETCGAPGSITSSASIRVSCSKHSK